MLIVIKVNTNIHIYYSWLISSNIIILILLTSPITTTTATFCKEAIQDKNKYCYWCCMICYAEETIKEREKKRGHEGYLFYF